MHFLLPMIGAGTDKDPRTINLPSWCMVGDVLPDGTVVIDIREDDLPSTHDDWSKISVERVGDLDVVTHVPDSVLGSWLRLLSERYDTLESTYKPYG